MIIHSSASRCGADDRERPPVRANWRLLLALSVDAVVWAGVIQFGHRILITVT